MSILACLSYLDEKSAYKMQKLQSKLFINSQYHSYWYLYLASSLKTRKSRIVSLISDPLNMVLALAGPILNKGPSNNESQLEQDYIMCIYFHIIFAQIDQLFKEKSISKIKINSTLSSEMEAIIKVAINIKKTFKQQSDIENNDFLKDIRSKEFDFLIDELIFILVNLSENPSKYSKYFTQQIVFSLENQGLSIIKHFVSIIQELDENVLSTFIELCFKEDFDKYNMFSILFKLLHQSEENEMLKSDSEISSQKSSDIQGGLLASIGDSKIIIKALLLGLYKSSSHVDNLVAISRLFFLMFLPYVFIHSSCPELIKRIENEIQELESDHHSSLSKDEANGSDDIEKILVRAIEIEEEYHIKYENNGMFKGLATSLIEGTNDLLGSNLAPLSNLIQLTYKVTMLVIPETLNLTKPTYSLERIESLSIYGHMLDYEFYLFLHEILGLSIKLSFAGAEIKQSEECSKIVEEIWSLLLQHSDNTDTIYSFLVYAKFKLIGKGYSISPNDNLKLGEQIGK